MVFKRKESFFLDLSGQDSKPAQVRVAVAPPAPAAAPPAPAAAPPASAAAAAGSAAAVAVPPAPATAPEAAKGDGAGRVLTTAELIAAELRAAQEARPAPSLATFAPDAITPGNALAQRRRRAGANLGGFKAMATSLVGKASPVGQ